MIAAVVLAAGRSQRFGYADKLLAPLHGMPLLAHTLRMIVKSPLRCAVVVTGPAERRIARLCRQEVGARTRLRLAHNSGPDQGMAQSLKIGLSALPHDCHAALICLGDMPQVDPQHVKRLARSWRPGLDYIRPVHRGRPGHPVLVSRSLFRSLSGLSGDHGAQQVLAGIPASRRRLLAESRGCTVDVDTTRALRRIRRRHPYENRYNTAIA